MSKDLITALEAIEYAARDLTIERRSLSTAARNALSRHRSSVESVELPEPFGYFCEWKPAFVGADGNQTLYYGEPGNGVDNDWNSHPEVHKNLPLYTATTVRSLIAAAVEREREQCHLIAEAEQLRREAIRYNKGEDHAWEGGAASAAEQIAAAIRARGEK